MQLFKLTSKSVDIIMHIMHHWTVSWYHVSVIISPTVNTRIKQGQHIHLHHASHFHTLHFSFSHSHALVVYVRTERDHQSCCPANGELCVCHSEVNHSQLWVVLRPVLRASRSARPSHQSHSPGTAYTSSGLRYTAVICSWTQHSAVTLPARTRVWPRRAACFWPGVENQRTFRTFGRRSSQGRGRDI